MGTDHPPWHTLKTLPAWQITEIPRNDHDDTPRRVLALTSAYGCSAPVMVAWLRERAGGPVRILTAGPGLAAGQDGEQTVLTVPHGARGARLADGAAARALAELPCWQRIGGVADVLLTEDGGPSLEEGLLATWLDAFAWLVFAEPVGDQVVNDLAAEAAHAQLTAEGHASPGLRLASKRAAARHEELRQAVTAGLWRVHLLAAGTTPANAARVARLLCATADLHGLPYALTPRPETGSLPDMLLTATRRQAAAPAPPTGRSWWDTPMDQQRAGAGLPDKPDNPAAESPFTSSTRLLAALARGPAREVPGLLFTLQPNFDITPEHIIRAPASHESSVATGVVLDGNRVPAGTLTLPLSSLNRHVFVCGATGAGKSQTVRNLLEHVGVPWLVVEPAKAEYRLMAARLGSGEVIRIRPGELGAPAAGINPLEPAVGPDGSRFPLQTHADLLRSLFLAAFEADEPFPQVLAAALSRCYEQAGWDLVTGTGVSASYPGLEDLQGAAMAVVDEIGYGREVRDNVRGFVTVRIGSLRLGTTGRFLDGGHPIDFAALLDRNVVLEIEDAGDDHDKAFLMGAVLIRLIEYLRLRARCEPAGPVRLRHLTVIEEAHRLLRQPGVNGGAAAHAVEMFADLLAEIRAYGEGLIIAEQIPAKLISDVIKNTAMKIVHRLPALDDREAVGATINLRQEQSEYLVTLVPGEAAVHADGMDYPLLARMPDGTSREAVPAACASAGVVIGRRSPTCGADCVGEACTLGQMRAAQLADGRITLWAELSVIAHLTGWTMPAPRARLTNDLHAMDFRLRDCALSQAVDSAVAARASVTYQAVNPGVLAGHVVAAMRQAISDGGWICERSEPQYLAPTYRAGFAHDDEQETRAIIWGTRPRPAIERAIGTRASTPDWEFRLTPALAAFRDLRWPLDYLRSEPYRPAREAET
jgi:hypothetical protein